jgi:hypothetical protein
MDAVGGYSLESLVPVKVGELSEMDLATLDEALEVPDLEAIQEITGLTVRDAIRLVTKQREAKTGYRVREVFCTRDARALAREVLSILAGYGVTPAGRRALAAMTPSLDRREVDQRFRGLSEFLKLSQEKGEEQMGKVLESLVDAGLTKRGIAAPLLIIASSVEEEARLIKKFGRHVRVRVCSEAEVHDVLVKESHVLSTVSFKGLRGITVLNDMLDPAQACPGFVIDYYARRKPLFQSALAVTAHLPSFFEEADLNSAKEALGLLDGLQEQSLNLEESIREAEDRVNDGVKKLMTLGGGEDEFKDLVESVLLGLEDELSLEEDEAKLLRAAALDVRSLPFAFSSSRIRPLTARHEARMAQARYNKLRNTAEKLEKHRENVERTVRRLFELGTFLAVARFTTDYDLRVPKLNDGHGIGFAEGRNLFLARDQLKGTGRVEPVSYSIGQTDVQLFGAENRPIVMLTGANSGGKTTLLETLAIVQILSLLGLPIPAEKADVPLVPLYLFRRRTVRKVGSLEYAIKVLRPVMTKRQSKVLLMDEFEALTEPGALGRIVASILNDLPTGSLTLFVTHLAREILPHLRTAIRIDGIEAKGIDDQGNLVVDRQPVFNHMGTSTPHFIISRLLKRAKNKRLQKAYQDMIALLEAGSRQ